MKKVKIAKNDLLKNEDMLSVKGGNQFECPKLKVLKCSGSGTKLIIESQK